MIDGGARCGVARRGRASTLSIQPLGSDLRITNFGGGNTSSKIADTDPLDGSAKTVLWIKGSGGDIGSMQRTGFATLYLDKVLALDGKYRGVGAEDEMVGLYPLCALGTTTWRPLSTRLSMRSFHSNTSTTCTRTGASHWLLPRTAA